MAAAEVRAHMFAGSARATQRPSASHPPAPACASSYAAPFVLPYNLPAHLCTAFALSYPCKAPPPLGLRLCTSLQPTGLDAATPVQAIHALPPVHKAAYMGSLQALLEAIRLHPEQINARADHRVFRDATPLHIAAHFGQKGRVQALIDAGADVDAVDGHWERRTPLHWVIARCVETKGTGYKGCLMALLAAGASIAAVPGSHQTAVHCAAACGDIDMLPRLLQQAPQASIDAIDNNGMTALLLAAKGLYSYGSRGPIIFQAYKASLRALLDAGASPTAAGRDGRTALHWVAGSGRCLMVLLRKGANVHAVDDEGCTALHIAVFCGRIACINRLAGAGANLAAQDKDGRAPLQAAGRGGRQAAAQRLQELEQAAAAQPGEQRAGGLGAVGKHCHGGEEYIWSVCWQWFAACNPSFAATLICGCAVQGQAAPSRWLQWRHRQLQSLPQASLERRSAYRRWSRRLLPSQVSSLRGVGQMEEHAGDEWYCLVLSLR